MVDTTNVQNPLAFSKASNEGGTAQQHKGQVFIGAATAAKLIFSQACSTILFGRRTGPFQDKS
jgi:nicotinamide mononucleotide (NMN) deamidase PncC